MLKVVSDNFFATLFFDSSIVDFSGVVSPDSLLEYANRNAVHLRFKKPFKGGFLIVSDEPIPDGTINLIIQSLKNNPILKHLTLSDVDVEIVAKSKVPSSFKVSYPFFVVKLLSPDVDVLLSLTLVRSAFYKTVKHIIPKDIDSLNLLLEIEDFRRKAYFLTSSIPWELDDFLSSLTDKQVQFLFNSMLTQGALTYDMLSTLVSALRNNGSRVFNSLSKRTQSMVLKVRESRKFFSSPRWIKEVLFLTKLNLYTLVGEENIKVESIEFLKELRERYDEDIARKNFEVKPFCEWVYEISQMGELGKLIVRVDHVSIAKALSSDPQLVKEFEGVMSKRGVKSLEEDVNYFVKRGVNAREILKSQMKIVDAVREIKYEKQFPRGSEEVSVFVDAVSSGEELEFTAYEAGTTDFIIAVKTLPLSVKDRVIDKLRGTFADLVEDFIKGKIKFPFSYGEKREKEARRKLHKTIWILRDEGKVNLNL